VKKKSFRFANTTTEISLEELMLSFIIKGNTRLVLFIIHIFRNPEKSGCTGYRVLQ